MATIASTPTRARAAEIAPAGSTITRPDGTALVLNGDVVLVSRPELERIVVQGRDLERTRAALAECEAEAMPEVAPPVKGPTWRTVAGALVAGVLLGGAAAMAHDR